MRFVTAAIALFATLLSTAAIADQPTVAATPTAAGLTRADLETWLDGFLPYAMNSGDVAGGVIVVVKNGEVLLQKGYGYADVEARKPVDPQRTLFRAGSVGKLVTHTAVMQLVEQGKLDLDGDIAGHLDFKIPDAYGKPVTLHNLMTHTGGFEETVRNLMASDPARHLQLEAYVKATRPARIFPPGEVPSYCNYCLTLEGYMLQRVAGEDFDDYLDRHIFAPLGMHNSTFRQPLPQKFTAGMSKGYQAGSGPAQYYELFGPSPAGSLATTGADMARFMIAHLGMKDGREPRLLQPQTAQVMHTRMFAVAPPTFGMAVGFFDRSRSGQHILEHGGDTQYFHSLLSLYMDAGVGLFMSFNSSGKEGAVYKIRTALIDQFTDRYFPAPLPNEATASTAVEHARIVVGRYAGSRRAETTFFRLFTLLGQTEITANEDGTLIVSSLTGLNDQPKQWREVAPFVWREVGGRERIAAQMQDGRVRSIGADSAGGILVLLPVPASQSNTWITPLVLAAIACLLITVIAWPIAAIVRRRRGTALALQGSAARAHRLVRIAALLNLVFLLGWTLIFQAGNDLANYDGHLDPWFSLLHLLGLLGVVGFAVALWNAWLAFQAQRSWGSRTWSVVLAASCIAITWFGFAFNLIRFSVRY
jgi:CubicO group peptidase (beta-lactamase class C family)